MKAKETYQSIKADMSSRIEQKLKELQALTADDIIDTYKEDIKALSVLDGKYPGTGGIRTFVTGRDRLSYDFIDLDQYYIKDEVDELIAKEESGRHDDDDKLSKEIEDLAEALEQETAERIEEDQKEHDRSVEADEKIGEAIETLREDLTTETEERKQADSEEASTREAADNQLQSNIDAEAATREAADNTLQANIDTEEAERKAADLVLQDNIDAEAATREDADNILQENIDKEAATREAADNTLQSNIDAEATTRENADNQLLANIDAEQKAREDADDNLQSEIDTEIADRENADNELWEALKEEAKTREDNDNTLQSNIDEEAKTREENDNTLQANIDKEQSEREAADDTLQQNINAEQAAREEADDTLQANLDQEAAERQEADDILQLNIDTEASERESADQQLLENLDNETAEREAADQVLQDNIDTKQNILTAGRGIDITDDVISCTFDHNVFIYCGTSLPEHPDEEDRYKIFLISNPNQTSEDNVLIEYIWIGESYLIGSWEKIGEFNAGIDLDLYYTKEEVDKITDNLQTQIDTNADNILTNADNIEQNASKIEINANNIEANAEAIDALDESKQDKLTAGNGITINEINGETIIAWTEEQRLVNVETGVEDNKTAIAGLDESKQDKLTAGNGISITKINDETIIAWTEEERLIAVETGVEDNSTAITDLDKRITTNESNIATNTSDISALESKEQADVDALNALVSDLTDVEHADFENVQNLIANLQVDVSTNATNIEANKDAISDLQNTKQDVLQAGDNITILDNVISAVDTTYTAGDHINISNTNVISADLDDYVTETELADLQSLVSANASDISVLLSNVSTNTSDITNLKSLVTSNISDISTLQAQVSEHTDAIIQIESDLSGKQDNLVAGDNIKISGDVISAVDTTYTAGDNVSISNTNVISVDLSNYATQSDLSDVEDNLSNVETELKDEISSKQDALIAGTGISIEDNIISCTLDHDVFVYAGNTLPEHPNEDDVHKIFLINNPNQTSSDNTLIEYIWVGSSYTTGSWEKIGEFNAGIDLDDYYTKSEVDAKINDVTSNFSDYYTKSEVDSQVSGLQSSIDSNTSAIETNASNISQNTSDISALEIKHQSDVASLNALISDLTGIEHADFENVQNLVSNLQTSVDTNTANIATNTSAISSLETSKQDVLTAGDNITISGNIISAVDTTYTAGDNISISNSNVISANLGDYATESDLANLQSQISANAGDISTLQSEVSSNTSNITNLQSQVTSNTSDISTLQSQVSSNSSSISSLLSELSGKQDTLVAGSNITISGNTISAVDTIYTAGDNVAISNANVISVDLSAYATEAEMTSLQSQVSTNASNITTNANNIASNTSAISSLQNDLSSKQDTLTAGDNITISGNTISATDTTYTAGDNVAISNTNVISVNLDSYAKETDVTDLQSQVSTNTSNIASNTASISDLSSSKQDALTAGDNVTISNNVISAIDTIYTAGTGIDISNDVISCTLDTELFIVTGGLPSEPDEADKNKIWVIPNDEAVPEDNQFIEYIWVDAWEKIGEFSASVDMTEYYTKTEVDNKLRDYATESDLSDLQEKLEKEITDAGGLSAINTTSTAPLTLTSSTSNGVVTISGSVDAYSKSDIDSKVSTLENEIDNIDLSDYATKSDLNNKQDTLTAGEGISISNNVISATATGSITGVTVTGTSPLTLTATNNDGEVSITGSVDLSNYVTSSSLSTTLESYVTSSSLSSTLESYATSTDLSNYATTSALSNYVTSITLSSTLESYAKTSVLDNYLTTKEAEETYQTKLTAGDHITISDNKVSANLDNYVTTDKLNEAIEGIIAGQGSDTAVNKVTVTNNDTTGILNISGTPQIGEVTITASINEANLSAFIEDYGYATKEALDEKQDKLTAGSNITISGTTISATDTTYTAGENVSISSSNVISVDLSNYYTKSDIGNNYYTKDEVDERIGESSSGVSSVKVSSDTLTVSPTSASSGAVTISVEADNYYTKSEVDSKMSSGGITNWNTQATAPLYLDVDISGTTGTIIGSISTATTSALGVVMANFSTSGSQTVNSASTTSGRYYGVGIDGNGKLYVNVPWEAGEVGGGITDLSVSGTSPLNLIGTVNGSIGTITGSVDIATIGTAGVVKPKFSTTGSQSVASESTTSGRYYGVGIDGNGELYVNVPWEKGDSSTSSGIDEITASGVSPLTLTATQTGSMVNISGSVDLSSYITTSSASSTYQTKLNYYTENTSSKSVDIGVGSASSIVLHTTETGQVTIGTAYCNGSMRIDERPYIVDTDISDYKSDNNVAVLGDLNDYQKKSNISNSVTFIDADGNTGRIGGDLYMYLGQNSSGDITLIGTIDLSALGVATQSWVTNNFSGGDGGGTTYNYINENTSSKTLMLGSGIASEVDIVNTEKTLFVIGTAIESPWLMSNYNVINKVGSIVFSVRPLISDINYPGDGNGNNVATLGDLNEFDERLRVFTCSDPDVFNDAGISPSQVEQDVDSFRKNDIVIVNSGSIGNPEIGIGILREGGTWETGGMLRYSKTQTSQLWLVIGNYMADPSIPRLYMYPLTGTPDVDDIVYGANLLGSFICGIITRIESNGNYGFLVLS